MDRRLEKRRPLSNGERSPFFYICRFYRLSSVEEVLGLYIACHLRKELLDQRIGYIERTPQDRIRSFL